jgi:hypothetical protein
MSHYRSSSLQNPVHLLQQTHPQIKETCHLIMVALLATGTEDRGFESVKIFLGKKLFHESCLQNYFGQKLHLIEKLFS